MNVSVIIRTKDEADRLRLTLESMAIQTAPVEVVIVNDGSSDHTREVIAEAESDLNIVAVHRDKAGGRCLASNTGAEHASGDVVLFLDGDTLGEPDFVAKHAAAHAAEDGLILRGETYNMRGTRPFLDPEAGTPRKGEEDRVARMSERELARSVVTREQIRNDFASIDKRSQPGVYPGFGPRKLYELEIGALREHPDCSVLWTASSGSNFSLKRDPFLASGGFDLELSNNEHRELALRLVQAGMKIRAVAARSYHLTHRNGWRDPLVEDEWEEPFCRKHPDAAVALMQIFWQSLADDCPLPENAKITSLPELERRSGRFEGIAGPDNIRRAYVDYYTSLASKDERVLEAAQQAQ